jgi:hypothetical protein
MTDTTSKPGSSSSPNLGARSIGVLLSPRETFAAVAARPKWFGILALTTVLAAAMLTAFMVSPSGQLAYMEKAAQGSVFGQPNEQQLQAIEKMAGIMGYVMGGATLITTPLFLVLIAGVAFLIFGVFTGGDAKFKQVFAIVAHSYVIPVLGMAVTLPVNYMRESLDSPMNLSVFFPMLSDGSFLMKLLGTVELFRVWWMMTLAIGLAVLYRKKTSSMATVLFVAYLVIALAVAAFTATGS